MLSDPSVDHLIRLFSVALEVAVDPDLDRPLSRRFLDAAQWFGEAARDDSYATSAVKYMTALERILMTTSADETSTNITEILSERVAALCFDVERSRNEWRKRAKDAYNLRSRLVHGSISPDDPKIRRSVGVAAEVAEIAIKNAISAFGEKGLRSKGITPKYLANWFQKLLHSADEYDCVQ